MRLPLALALEPTGVGDQKRMLDVIYILIGAAFLGGAILYAFACDCL